MTRRERQRRRQRQRGHPVKRVLLMTSMLTICAVVLGIAGVVGWVVHVADSAPNINQLKPRDPGQVSEVFAGNGSLLGYIASDVLRTELPQSQQPNLLREATVAIEDRRFWHHGGVDYQGILRAGLKDLFDGGTVQGGSTLTMQLVDNVYLPNNIRAHHNIRYKIIQAKLANELESQHTKHWILTQYLNDVDYGTMGGQTAYGVAAASQLFFNKPVDKLDLAQIALLAGLPQAPSDYNPFLAPDLARQRRSQVLGAMVQSGYVTQSQADTANAAPLEVQRNDFYQYKRQPYVFDYVKQQLIKRFGLAAVERGGLKVYTTIDLRKQAIARAAILAHEGGAGQPAAALVTVDPSSGHIEAMATSSNYDQSNFDYATQAQRQTGSSFKPFVLMTLIHDEHGDPFSTYYNSHFLAPGWLPGYPTYSVHTAEMTYQGTISVARAMTVSDNTVFAQLGPDLGMDRVDATAHAMGITSPLFGYPSEAIGGLHIGVSPLQMADAYATISNGGTHYDPTIISKVVFQDGSVVNLGEAPHKTVFTDGETYTATKVLKTVITSGTGTAAGYGCPAAGKTGTTSSFTDAWFVGYTPRMSTAVWVGYPNDTQSMVNGFGGTLAAPIWHDYMQQSAGSYCGDFPQPTVPFVGTPYFGKLATTGAPITTKTTSTTPTTTTTTPNQYTNPTLYAQPPQGNGNGKGNGKPPGFGNGHGGGNNGGAGLTGH